MCTFVVTNISNASTDNSLFGNITNNLNFNNQLLFNDNQSNSSINTNDNNNDIKTISDNSDDYYRTQYCAEYNKKEIEITLGNIKNNIPYKVVVNDIYEDSSNTKNFPTIKKLASNLKNITNNVLSSNKGTIKYNGKIEYTFDDVEIDDYMLYLLTLNGNDSKNPSIVNLIFNTFEMGDSIIFNNIKCNNISKLNLLFNNSKSQPVHFCINNITSNNDMNITSNIPLCINDNSKQYFNYKNNSVDINIGTGNNVIKINPFYNAIQKFNEILLNMYGSNNISKLINKYQEALKTFPPKNKYYLKAKKLNMSKYIKAIKILQNIIKLCDSEVQVLKYFYNIHKIFSNDLYNVLK